MRKPKDPKTVKQKKPAEPTAEDDGGETSSETEPKTEPEAPAESEAADALALDEAPHGDPAHDDPAPDNLPSEDHGEDEEPERRSLAATALMVLVGVLFIASLTLWAAPKLAPNLPAGVAKYLLPGQIDTEGRLAGLDDAVAAATAKSDAAIAALNAEIAALGTRLDAAAEARQGDASQTESAIAAAQSAADAAADSAAADAASLAARLDAIEAGLASLSDEFGAVSTALADAGTGEGATPPEIAAAIAALGARLDSLTASVEGGTAAQALEARIAALGVRLDTASHLHRSSTAPGGTGAPPRKPHATRGISANSLSRLRFFERRRASGAPFAAQSAAHCEAPCGALQEAERVVVSPFAPPCPGRHSTKQAPAAGSEWASPPLARRLCGSDRPWPPSHL